MKTLRLQETSAERIHVRCLKADGTTFCIDTKRCSSITVPDDVVDVQVTPLNEPPVGAVKFIDKVDFVVV